MKKVLGLDLGTTSIGWALVHEAESEEEKSSIIKLGVRVNPLTVDESTNYEKGKSIETNAARTLKRSMRRNLQRFKLRREVLIDTLKKAGIISDETLLSEHGNKTTFETLRLRAQAATDKISLAEFARVLLMINKQRGYKSSRKAKGGEDGTLIDGMEIAKKLYNEDLTPGALSLQILQSGKKHLPDYYRSDLQAEFDRIWDVQQQFYPTLLTQEVYNELKGRNSKQTWAILSKHLIWEEEVKEWDNESATHKTIILTRHLEGIKSDKKGIDLKIENLQRRVSALSHKIGLEELTIVLQDINAEINSSSGYLGAISDRSKELYFNHQTVGQYLWQSIKQNPHFSLKNRVFYRQDYIDEFETLWETQAQYHPELTPKLKSEIRDTVIFYQRCLKSQKGLISFCEFEREERIVEVEGKQRSILTGLRVIPRSSPLFQEFKIWQTLNNIIVSVGEHKSIRSKKGFKNISNSSAKRPLTIEEKEFLAQELSIRSKLSKNDALKLLFDNPGELDLNIKEISGNETGHELFQAYSKIIEMSGHEPLDFKKSAVQILEQVHAIFESLKWNTEVLTFDSNKPLQEQAYYRLWHLLYSFEGDNTLTGDGKLKEHIATICGFDKEYSTPLCAVSFKDDYGSLSAKAIGKILPFMKDGNLYDVACTYAGYRHSASSLTKEEIENKELKEKLDLIPKGNLRNPVVEKILNQMVNVINTIIDTYGCPDEIRVELARELKKNQKEREELTKSIATATKEHEAIRAILSKEPFNLSHISRNDILRYRLYEELKDNGYHTLYSNTYITPEKLFSKDFDIEHIIPQARLFDDSFSNKTLELGSINKEKGNKTAHDFVLEKYGEEGLKQYISKCESLFKEKKNKLRKLKMKESDIPEGFIERDLRNTQYISKKALEMLHSICRRVVATTGSITDRLRQDWQLVDIMKELNWEKYESLGKVEYFNDRDGRRIGRITDWTKRNDHRHHAMDALTVAFTKDVFIQYFNNKNASNTPNSNEYAIKNKYFCEGKAIAPIPLDEFRAEALKHLDEILISIKAKNKVVTQNINRSKKKTGHNKKVQLTPRGQLHLESIFGSHKQYVTKEEKVNADFDRAKILTVCDQSYRLALLLRLESCGNDPKKAFTGKNALDKNPIWLNEHHSKCVPPKVKTVRFETVYTIRKPITPDLNVDKVIDPKIKQILTDRINEYGDAKKAFSNLEENPIWLNREKGIQLKRVTIEGISNAQALHDKRDKDGNLILDKEGRRQPVDFVNTGNNHHVAIYRRPKLDKKGLPAVDEQRAPLYEIEERVVSFYEVVARVNEGLPIIDKTYGASDGWEFLFSMKQNEYFVFPNEKTGFNPKEIDLLDPKNYALISPNLFRVQKLSSKYYNFRHHLETTIEEKKELQEISWKRITSLPKLLGVVKVRINHIGQIVSVGEY